MASYEYDSQNDKLNRIAGGTLYADCPIGSYIPFGGTVIPTGWLLCDGRAVSRADYADLFAVIGTAHGSGDGSTTFNIPDLREAVPKGAGLTGKSNNHLDADGLAVGEFLDDRIQNITGSLEAYSDKNFIPPTDYSGQGAILPIEERSNYGSSATSDSEIHTIGFSFDASRIVRAGATTEAKAVGSNYIIKAKQIGVPADFASAIANAIKKEYIVSNGNTLTGNGKYDLIKCGNVIELNIYNLSYASTVGDVCPVIIPEEYRPTHSFVVAGSYGSGSLGSNAVVLFLINENGGVYSYTYSDFVATNSNNLHAVWTV